LASEDGLKIDAETLRRWMLAEGLWSRERRRRRHRRRRERKEHFGELVQLDGSFHPWLEERGPEGCLIDLVDDATNKTWAHLGEQETIWAVTDGLRAWIERYGIPLALYVDWKNLYKRPATPKERLRGEEPVTQFGHMCAKRKWVPPANHPWREAVRRMMQKRASQGAVATRTAGLAPCCKTGDACSSTEATCVAPRAS
jgi:hypothetical protein